MRERRIFLREDGEILEMLKEKAGIISENDVWVCLSPGYLYTADTFHDLVRVIETEWQHEKHITG